MSDAAPSPCPVVRARSILQKVRTHGNEWFGIDYNMNLYRGCCHGCIYCDSRSACYGVEDFARVRVKKDALPRLRQELAACRESGVVATGSMSDPYNPLERRYGYTRGLLELLDRYCFGAAIATKGTLVERDIDLLQRISTHSPVIVKITVTTPHDALSALVEPHAPPSSRRLAALEALSRAGGLRPSRSWLKRGSRRECCSCRCCPFWRTIRRTSVCWCSCAPGRG